MREGAVGWFGGYIVKVAFYNVNIRRDGTEKVVCFAVGDVACTYRLLDFSWDEKFFKFCGQGGCAGGDVQVSYYEDEDHRS
jgi:hypothetical protein